MNFRNARKISITDQNPKPLSEAELTIQVRGIDRATISPEQNGVTVRVWVSRDTAVYVTFLEADNPGVSPEDAAISWVRESMGHTTTIKRERKMVGKKAL